MRTPQVKYVVWLFLLAVLLIPVSVWPGGSFDYIIGAYWKTVLFFLMVLFWARSVLDMRRIIWASCLGVSALVLSGLVSGVSTERFQAGSGTYDANDLALVLAITLPLLMYLFSSSGPAVKFISSAMMLICIYGIILTGSRGGFLALLGVGFLIVFRSKIGTATKVGIIVLALAAFGSLAGGEYWSRISTIWSPVTEYDQTAGGRTTLWKAGLKILATHPWGVGINNYTVASGLSSKLQSEGGVGYTTAHNSFLQIAVELGIVGLFLFLALMMKTIKELRKIQGLANKPSVIIPNKIEPNTIRSKENLRERLLPLANALETSLLGFVIGGFFLSQAYSSLLYCILALSLACKRMVRENDKLHAPFPMRNERTIKMRGVGDGT